MRILLAEDNKINQKFALALLGKAGYKIEVVENGHQAVDAVRHGDYDLVLMDVQMPELDGVEATKRIRALPAPKCNIPIVALTAHAMSGAKEEYLEAGMNDYVSKPIQPAVLFAKLEQFASASHDSGNIAADLAPRPGGRSLRGGDGLDPRAGRPATLPIIPVRRRTLLDGHGTSARCHPRPDRVVASCERSHPPPMASISDTLAVTRFSRTFNALCSVLSAVVWAVMTLL